MNAIIYMRDGAGSFTVKNLSHINEVLGSEVKRHTVFDEFIVLSGYSYVFVGDNIATLNGADILYVNFIG